MGARQRLLVKKSKICANFLEIKTTATTHRVEPHPIGSRWPYRPLLPNRFGSRLNQNCQKAATFGYDREVVVSDFQARMFFAS